MPLTWADCYERHFQKYFHKPYDIVIYRTAEGQPLKMAHYDHAYKNHHVYASLGLADLLPEGQVIGEVFTMVDAAVPDVPFLLVNALFFLLQQKIPLDARATIGGIESLRPDFAEYFDKTAFYFKPSQGIKEDFHIVPCGLDKGKIFEAIFVSQAEDEYIEEKGGPAFEARAKAQQADLYHLRRASVI